MRISDWISDVCSSDLCRPSSCPSTFCAAGAANDNKVGAACATAPTAVIRAASLAAQTRRAGWANRAQTETLSAACVFNRAKSASLRTAYLAANPSRSEEHTSELQYIMRISYAVFCLQ